MAYLGGKSKNSNHIIDVLNQPKYNNVPYFEPFVGYAHILRRIKHKSSYTAADANPLLISLLKGIQEGLPIPRISKSQYDRLRHQNGNYSFQRAVACFTYSFNGGAWRGYVGEPYVQQRINYYKKLAQNPAFMSTELIWASYDQFEPNGMLIYCDPPYKGTTQYNIEGQPRVFDTSRFWQIMRKWSKNNVVFISEYEAPADFVCVASSYKYSSFGVSKSVRIEKLFTQGLAPLNQ